LIRHLLTSAAAVAALAAAGAATAAPSVQIKDAVARVVVIPEARSDVKVEILTTNNSLPLTIRQQGDKTVVDGDLRMNRINGCNSVMGRVTVHVRGVGDVKWDDIPRLVVRVPMNADVAAGGAVFGEIGRTDSLELSNAGCGDWTVANVKGRLKLNQAGSGDTHAGSADAADINLAGSGDISLQQIADDLEVNIAGSGDVSAASIGGDLDANVMGSGDVTVAGGHARSIQVSVAGSGDVTFDGVAERLKASVMGSGDVHVAKVTGDVHKSVAGSGNVTYGN